MNVFRSLARSFRNALDFRKKSAEEAAPEQERAASRIRAGFERAYRSAFRPSASGDGFEVGARGPRVDLTGGVKFQYVIEEPILATPPMQSDFVASLDDLGLLMEAEAVDQPQPSSFPPQPLDFFEPMDVFEYPAPVAAEVSVAAVELPVVPDELPVAAEVPVAADPVTPPPAAVAQPMAAGVAQPQYTVQLLIPVEVIERAVQSAAVEQFSTLELLDTVAQLSGDEQAPQKEEEPAVARPSSP